MPAALLLATPSVQAQAERAGPVAFPTLQYRSALAQYRRFDDQSVTPWRETNDTVGAIGGWRVYAREARQPEPGAGSADPAATGQGAKSEASRAMPGSHMGHGGKP
ncbi:MAG: hypothetical protein ACMG6H_01350 [Acidobacteriota bacterium]